MAITKTERIDVELPKDILFAMEVFDNPEKIRKKIKIALAIFLFQEGAISLDKATELAEMSRAGFIDVLREHGMTAYEYGEKDFEREQQIISEVTIREKPEEFLRIQMHSRAYQEWLSSENDIYDELFQDEIE